MTTKFPITDADFSRYTPQEQGGLLRTIADTYWGTNENIAWFLTNLAEYFIQGKQVPSHKVAKHLFAVPDLPTKTNKPDDTVITDNDGARNIVINIFQSGPQDELSVAAASALYSSIGNI